MKFVNVLLLAVAFWLTAGQAHAINLGSVNTGNSNANQAIKQGSKASRAALEAAINDKIKKENCAFVDAKTENKTTCNLDKVIKTLANWRSGLESTIANDVDVHIEASAVKNDLAWKRVSFVEDKMKQKLSYWDWYSHKTTANANNLKIWVKVK